ncbi:hypothetical protein [Azospirillum sp. TSH58]|nr:hypothetical protein [Azospirillum sp. TSH58]
MAGQSSPSRSRLQRRTKDSIESCGDSSHTLAGQTVDLPDIPVDEMD